MSHPNLIFPSFIFALWVFLAKTYTTAQALSPSDPLFVWGVTIDAVDQLSYIVDSLASLPVKPTTRIVFDEWVNPSQYTTAVNSIHNVSFIMGEILDSAYVSQYSLNQYTDRANAYLDAFTGKVELWEIGNEVNGEWLGTTPDVIAKISAAYSAVKSRNQKTVLTLYNNGVYDNGRPTENNCWEKPQNQMIYWAQNYILNDMKQGLDYVLISYYEEDCLNIKPDWADVFNQVAAIFPNSKIGFGEIGSTGTIIQKTEYLQRYYTTNLDLPQYIGGYFWWYYKQDMVPKTKTLYNVLYNTILAQINSTPSPSPLPQKPGDTDTDGDVDFIDALNLTFHFTNSWTQADFNQNGQVDIFDYKLLISNFGQ